MLLTYYYYYYYLSSLTPHDQAFYSFSFFIFQKSRKHKSPHSQPHRQSAAIVALPWLSASPLFAPPSCFFPRPRTAQATKMLIPFQLVQPGAVSASASLSALSSARRRLIVRSLFIKTERTPNPSSLKFVPTDMVWVAQTGCCRMTTSSARETLASTTRRWDSAQTPRLRGRFFAWMAYAEFFSGKTL